MKYLLLAGALLPVASAQTYETTQAGQCACAGLCDIGTLAECEQAAATLSLDDTSANGGTRADWVPGCSTNKLGGLRYNSDLASEHLQDVGRRPLKVALCEVCTSTLVPAVPAGCVGLGSYAITYAARCECDGLCTIETQSECELAATELALSDTKANPKNNDIMAPGCSTNNQAGLRFNAKLDTTHYAENKNLKHLVCSQCDSAPLTTAAECNTDATTTDAATTDINTITSAAPFTLAAAIITSDDAGCVSPYCVVSSSSLCGDLAASLGLSDTVAEVVTFPNMIPGCLHTPDGLKFNNANPAGAHDGLTEEICMLCG